MWVESSSLFLADLVSLSPSSSISILWDPLSLFKPLTSAGARSDLPVACRSHEYTKRLSWLPSSAYTTRYDSSSCGKSFTYFRNSSGRRTKLFWTPVGTYSSLKKQLWLVFSLLSNADNFRSLERALLLIIESRQKLSFFFFYHSLVENNVKAIEQSKGTQSTQPSLSFSRL